jgi:putative drug exporter of the RND superfamily
MVRWWWAVLLLWAIGLTLAVTAAPRFADVATFDDSAFLPEGSRAALGHDLLEEGWPQDNFTRSAVVALVRPDGPLTGADEAYARDLSAWLESPAAPDPLAEVTTHLDNPQLEPSLTSSDGHAMLLIVGLDEPPFSPNVGEAVKVLRARAHDGTAPEGLGVYVTGSAGFAVDEDDAIDASLARTQVLTVVLVLGLLLWIFRSPVAALVPLLTVGAGYVMALAVVGLLAQAGLQVTYLFQTFAIVIVFGAGTDYSLLTMTRYAEDLGEENLQQIAPAVRGRTLVATLAVLGGALLSAAGSTIVGFSAQSVARFGLFRTMGPALAVAVTITLAAGLTLTPALMRAFGGRLFWPEGWQRPPASATPPEPVRSST